MWTKAQTATFQRALATVQKLEATLEHLQQIAKVSPQFEDRINELALRAANLEALATVALTAETT